MRATAAAALIAAVALGACGGGRDPIVGKWASDSGRTIEFKAGGAVDLPLNNVATDCADAADAIAACAAHGSRWRRGAAGHYQLIVPAVSRGPRGSSFDAPTPCRCGSETALVTLHGDELAVDGSAERLTRLR